MAFQLDTSGHFHVMPGHPLHRFMAANILTWDGLDPFTQGYIRAVFETFRKGDIGFWPDNLAEKKGFSSLASDTLAGIMEDCAAFQALPDWPHHDAEGAFASQYGRDFWTYRNSVDAAPCLFRRLASAFPPLTPVLCDDGKVRFADQIAARPLAVAHG